jgi:hypothetical protein
MRVRCAPILEGGRRGGRDISDQPNGPVEVGREYPVVLWWILLGSGSAARPIPHDGRLVAATRLALGLGVRNAAPRSADWCRKLIEGGAEERVAALRDRRGVQRATVAGEPR